MPQLPSPNARDSNSPVLPTRLSDLTQDIDTSHGYRPVKKALKGLSALRLSLSWVLGLLLWFLGVLALTLAQ